jgi:hypothetical protein
MYLLHGGVKEREEEEEEEREATVRCVEHNRTDPNSIESHSLKHFYLFDYLHVILSRFLFCGLIVLVDKPGYMTAVPLALPKYRHTMSTSRYMQADPNWKSEKSDPSVIVLSTACCAVRVHKNQSVQALDKLSAFSILLHWEETMTGSTRAKSGEAAGGALPAESGGLRGS